MARNIVLEVPDAVTSHFVLATTDPPDNPYALVRDRLARELAAPLREVVCDLIGSSLLEIRTFLAAESGFADVLGAWSGTDAEADARLEKATHHLVVVDRAPPLGQPEHAQAARAIARTLAAATDAAIADARSSQVFPYDFRLRPEHPEFCLADDWLHVFITQDEETDPDPGLWPPGPSLCLTTSGMHRFGLPDLELLGAPADGCTHVLNLLRCLTARLLSQHWEWLAGHPGQSTRRIGTHLWVEAGDLWRYWAADPFFPGGDDRLRVRLARVADECPGAPPYLRVGPPADFDGSRTTWWTEEVQRVMLPVAGAPRASAA